MLIEKNMRIGILGGGQLGSMLIRSAIDFGLHVSVLDTDAAAPAGRYTNSFMCGDPNKYDDVIAFGANCDIITIEKEAVNTDALTNLRARGVKVYPSPELISIIQDKQQQKEFLKSHGIPTAGYVPVNGKEELLHHVSKMPGCLKLRCNGYDGKGVMMLHSEKDIDNAFDGPSILEEKVDIKQEISVIVARSENGDIELYEPTLMVFHDKHHLLDYQICPADIEGSIAEQASEIATKVANEMSLVGIMAIEMFITADGQLLVNEIAPRAHNSGHHTIEACITSQYEQQIRAISGLPLGKTSLICKAGLINLLETGKKQDLAKIANIPNAHLHYYGKSSSKIGRKIGHITITEPEIEDVIAQISTIKNILN